MDYLDPKKRAQHTVVLFTGYILIGFAIAIATTLLLHQAYGFSFGKNGTVVHNGLLFFSSQPNPADIYINGELSKSQTNTRMVLPEKVYDVELRREGYVSWKRTIGVEGGRIFNFDYPLLLPEKLEPVAVATYGSAPAIVTQSPDRRWIVVAQTGSLTVFDVYDTQDMEKPPVVITLPDSALTTPAAADSARKLEISEWSANNRHFVLKHIHGDTVEYILVDREEPSQSQNLSKTLPFAFAELKLIDRKFDRYFLLSNEGALSKIKLGDQEATPYLENVLAYRSYSDNTVLYATPSDDNADEVSVRLRVSDNTHTIRSLPANTNYLLDFTRYDNVPYAVVGAGSDDRVYIYKDPRRQLVNLKQKAAAPMQVLRVPDANFVSFSSNTQYVMVQNNTNFAVYDLKNENGYNFKLDQPIDQPQANATWMDGNRLTYVSGGKQFIAEYDSRNSRTLTEASPNYLSSYTRDYEDSITFAPGDNGEYRMLRTPFRTPADQ